MYVELFLILFMSLYVIFFILWYIYYLRQTTYKKDKEMFLFHKEQSLNLLEERLNKLGNCCDMYAKYKTIVDNVVDSVK